MSQAIDTFSRWEAVMPCVFPVAFDPCHVVQGFAEDWWHGSAIIGVNESGGLPRQATCSVPWGETPAPCGNAQYFSAVEPPNSQGNKETRLCSEKKNDFGL